MNKVDANDVIEILVRRIANLEKELAVQIALNMKKDKAEK